MPGRERTGAADSPAFERAVYFGWLEAMQNAGKRAGTGATAVVRLAVDAGAVSFAVSDDGVGFDAPMAGGDGLLSRRDRGEALGGALEVTSVPGRGTTVRGRIPLPRDE